MGNDSEDSGRGVNPMIAGLAGVAVGAAAAAGAIVLSDEKNRKKLEKVLGELKDQGFKVLEVVQKEAGHVKKLSQKTETKNNKSKKTPSKK